MSTGNRIDNALSRLAAAGKKGLLPYVTAGLPDLATTECILEALSDAGAIPPSSWASRIPIPSPTAR